MRRVEGWRLTVALAAYSVLAAVLFRGLLAHPSTHLPHDLGDPVLSTWILWWNAHRVPLTGAWWDGLSFYPGHGALALSDHRLGLWPIATPIQWLGGSPVLAHNAAFLLSFPLCAIAAHALAWSLTRSHAAAAIAGLVFGFNPYRIAHLEHLELLSAYWLPVVLLSAHRVVETGSRQWLAALGFAWLMQALCSSYYLLYGVPLVALWVLWFARADNHGWTAGAIVATIGVASTPLIPIALGFWRIHRALGIARTLGEVQWFSADLASILSASPLLAVWRSAWAAGAERELFPGAVAIALVVAGAFAGRMIDRQPRPRARGVTIALAIAGSVLLIAAAVAARHPFVITVGPLTLAAGSAIKPASEAIVLLACAALSTRAFSVAWRTRSAFAFYAIAALVMWACALGPRPTLFDRPALYRGLYAALMWLPGYDTGLRVPARFATLAILALSVAAALAAHRIGRRMSPARGRVFFCACLIGILIDGAVRRVPVFAAPRLETLPTHARDVSAVLELPLGDSEAEIASVMRTIGYERPVVNGYSGYLPPHYRVLQAALARRDTSVLDALSRFGPIAVGVSRGRTADVSARYLAEYATAVGSTPLHDWFVLPARASADERMNRPGFEIRRVEVMPDSAEVPALAHGGSRWVSPRSQQGAEMFQIELERPQDVSEVLVGTGREFECWPRALAIATSLDGRTWTDAWRGNAGGAAFLAALENPRSSVLRFAFPPRPARFVRIQQTAHDEIYPWIVTTLAVLGE